MAQPVTLIGNLTRDFELKVFESGRSIAKSGLAITERKRDAEGNWGEGDTSFFDLVVFDSMTANVIESLAKGDRVIVHGRLRVRDFEKQDGTNGRSVEVLVDEVAPSLRWATAKVTKNPKVSKGSSSAEEDYFG